MQRSGSQIGISGAIVRRSTLAVPVGNMPSGGIALDWQQVALAREQCGR